MTLPVFALAFALLLCVAFAGFVLALAGLAFGAATAFVDPLGIAIPRACRAQQPRIPPGG
jgi:hypothetical protein